MSIDGMKARSHDEIEAEARWSAVYGMSLCVFVLIAAEFLPLSLLTPIAAELGLRAGEAGQAISISGVFAVLASLAVTRLPAGVDRRQLILALTGLMLLSALIVAFARCYAVLMLGRALLGLVIGGFWSLSAAVIIELVPPERVPRALSVLNGGNALATILAAPLGSYIGSRIGWRGAFFCVAPLAVMAFIWLYLALPSLPGFPRRRGHPADLLKRRAVSAALLAVAALFMGNFALFTYVRPFLESVTQVSGSLLSVFLFLIGLAGLSGTLLISSAITRHGLPVVLTGIPLLMAGVAVALIFLGQSQTATALLLAGWGLLATSSPVGWWTWLSRTLPDDAEVGGGLMVATIQLAITLGASLGGLALDASGYAAAFSLSAVLLILSAALARSSSVQSDAA